MQIEILKKARIIADIEASKIIEKLLTTLLGDDFTCHNWLITGYIRSGYTGTGR